MRKQVTFVENLKKENRIKNESNHILRSGESNKKSPNGVEYVPCQQIRDIYGGTHMNAPSGNHMKSIHIPKCMMTAPFLQHPSLTVGQRRYLCSIANIYSTEHMKRQMKQHYLNVLHTCLKSGQTSSCRRRHGDLQHKDMGAFRQDAEEARARPQGQRKSRSRANSDVIFPKIVN